MNSRADLHAALVQALGSNSVYYQPPTGFMMKYPCIVYNLQSVNTIYADGRRYETTKVYDVTLIGKDPDTTVIQSILDIPFSKHTRRFTSDNLYHDVFAIYTN